MQCKSTWLQCRVQLRLRRGSWVTLRLHDPDFLVLPCATVSSQCFLATRKAQSSSVNAIKATYTQTTFFTAE